jgi:lipoprotein NlpD
LIARVQVAEVLKRKISRIGFCGRRLYRQVGSFLFCGFIAVALGLAGCTASWRAPVESRADKPTKQRPQRGSIRADYYRVRSGDTLFGIAWQKGVDYRLVASWNGIRPPYRIYAGQTLRLKPPQTSRKTTNKYKPVARPKTQARAAARPSSTAAPKPAPKKPVSTKKLNWRWPVNGKVVSRFKAGDPLRKGIKIAGRSGKTVLAAEGGKVVYSGSGLIGYGRLIIVKHNDNYLSAYGHNRTILVSEGDRITRGKKIAEMGTANNGDPMLHFEIRRDGKPVDPLRLLPRR